MPFMISIILCFTPLFATARPLMGDEVGTSADGLFERQMTELETELVSVHRAPADFEILEVVAIDYGLMFRMSGPDARECVGGLKVQTQGSSSIAEPGMKIEDVDRAGACRILEFIHPISMAGGRELAAKPTEASDLVRSLKYFQSALRSLGQLDLAEKGVGQIRSIMRSGDGVIVNYKAKSSDSSVAFCTIHLAKRYTVAYTRQLGGDSGFRPLHGPLCRASF